MGIIDRKITAFSKKISDRPMKERNQGTNIKSYIETPSNELKSALNGAIDDIVADYETKINVDAKIVPVAANSQNALNKANALENQIGDFDSRISTATEESGEALLKTSVLEGQFNQLIINAGESNAEVVAARVKANGTTFASLPDRLDAADSDFESHLSDFMTLQNEVNDLKNNAYYISPTGTGDDTDYLNNVIATHTIVILKQGIYYINPTQDVDNFGWTIPSNRTIIFEEGAELHAIPNAENNYRIMYFVNVDNVTVLNPVCIGDKGTHTGTTGQGGHAIGLYYSTNIKIYHPIANDCWGCGIGIVNCEDIYIHRALCDNNRQNNIAIIGGKNITIFEPKLTNCSGTLPAAGIDIEPNFNTELLDNIRIIRPITKNNDGAGVLLGLGNLVNGSQFVDITINNHSDYNSTYGLQVGFLSNGTGALTGVININNPNLINSKKSGIRIDRYEAINTPTININNPVVINPNDSAETVNLQDGSGIAIYREAGISSTTKIGNINIINPLIKDVRSTKKMLYGMYIADLITLGFEKLLIKDPLDISGTVNNNINYKMAITQSGAHLTDSNKVLLNEVTSSFQLIDRGYTLIKNTGSVALINFLLPTSAVITDNSITFTNVTDSGFKITPAATHKILPLSTVAGKYIQTTVKGSSVTLKRLTATEWIIENLVGTWTVET